METGIAEEENNFQIIPNLAFGLLNEAEILYNEESKFSAETLQSLYSMFGTVLTAACDLLENSSFILYKLCNGTRQLLKVMSRNEQYTLFTNINFCHCHAFKYQVLHAKNAITCKHVLAGKLAQICGQIKTEIVTDNQLADLLNYQCEQHNLWK